MSKVRWYRVEGTGASVSINTPLRQSDLSGEEKQNVRHSYEFQGLRLAEVGCEISPGNRHVSLPREVSRLHRFVMTFSVRKNERDAVTLIIHNGHICGHAGENEKFLYYSFSRKVGEQFGLTVMSLANDNWIKLCQFELEVTGKNSVTLAEELLLSRRINGKFGNFQDLPIDNKVLEEGRAILGGKKQHPKFEPLHPREIAEDKA